MPLSENMNLKQNKKIIIPLAFLTLFFAPKLTANEYDFMLAGGALKGCSSYSLGNCRDETQFLDAKDTTLYEMNEKSLNRLKKFMQNVDAGRYANLSKMVDYFARNYLSEKLTRGELFDYFESIKVDRQVNDLPDHEYFALLDLLELAQNNKNSERKKETADFMQSKSKATRDIWQAFAANTWAKHQSKLSQSKEKPLVLVVTASSRDNFEAVDFYLSGIQSLGLDAIWLPLSAALLTAIEESKKDANACSNLEDYRRQFNQYDRARVYPDLADWQFRLCQNPKKIIELINNASAIFFNGGDQSKTLAAFEKNGVASEFLLALQHKVKSKRILVGGTSAGTAVQSGGSFAKFPIPMITNGTSERAMQRGARALVAPSIRCTESQCEPGMYSDDLTYRASGGLDLFSLGTLDTHFSERDREARLIVLTQQTQTRYGFGVDETTALFARYDDVSLLFKVIGQAGVFVVDNTISESKQVMINGQINNTFAGSSHFFPSGTTGSLTFSENQWDLSFNHQNQVYKVDEGAWRMNSERLCKRATSINFAKDNIQYLMKLDEKSQTFNDKNKKTCGYLFLNYAISTVSN